MQRVDVRVVAKVVADMLVEKVLLVGLVGIYP